MNLNILFYIPYINQEMGGIRQYSVTLLKILGKDPENKYYVFHESDDPEIMAVLNANPQFTRVKSKADKEKIVRVYFEKVERRILSRFPRFTFLSTKKDPLEKICKKYSIDIVHCPYQYLPEAKTAKSICTMHDMQELHFPEYFTPEERAYRATNYLNFIKNSDGIIVSYQHIKNDIIKYFQASADKISVCLLDMGNLWLERYQPTDIELLDVLDDSSFILYPANTWEHKNHKKLLEAILLLKDQGRTDIKLVCSGHRTPYYQQSLHSFIENNGLQSQVTFLGVVDEKILYSLYKKCLGTVVPTLYEAGSFPLVESILLDVPVICSNVTSLPETIGDSRFVFDPLNAADISRKIKQLWDDTDFREQGLLNCKKQAMRLRDTNSLRIIKDIYQNQMVKNDFA